MALLINIAWPGGLRSAPRRVRDFYLLPPDSINKDTSKLVMPYPIRDKKSYETEGKRHPLDLNDPEVIKNQYKLDPENYRYDKSSKIGELLETFTAVFI